MTRRSASSGNTAAKTNPQTEAVLNRLDGLAQNTPDLAGPIAFYRLALPALREAQANVEPFTLAPEAARQKLDRGLPLLVGEDLPLDIEATRNLFLRLCRIAESLNDGSREKEGHGGWSFFSRGQPDSLALLERAQSGDDAVLRSAAAEQIRRAVERDELDLTAVWGMLASGDWGRLELTATGLKLDGGLLQVIALNSLRPSLRAWAQTLKGAMDLARWRRGLCPMCGSPPLLGEIQGKEGERRLRCGSCGADWGYPRLKCPFCANQDYKSLGYISVEGEEEKYHLQTCEKCRSYLKVVVTFDPTPVDQLPVEDLATIHLDLIAAERDYVRVPLRETHAAQ